jgi:hypothetical protein
MRCRALPGGTSTGRPARDDNPQARAIVQKSAVDVDPKMAGGFLSAIQKANCIASDSRQLSKKLVQPFFGRIATKAAD